ncbi:hypothetical protein VTJ49DRAFT_2037 [Mycothermus thermophilus]|uniref:Uncharacterized protein n=1 Tax=Humicola insolens TaxID=85995 RepID=A0ABR3VAT4_HUMIN
MVGVLQVVSMAKAKVTTAPQMRSPDRPTPRNKKNRSYKGEVILSLDESATVDRYANPFVNDTKVNLVDRLSLDSLAGFAVVEGGRGSTSWKTGDGLGCGRCKEKIEGKKATGDGEWLQRWPKWTESRPPDNRVAGALRAGGVGRLQLETLTLVGRRGEGGKRGGEMGDFR